MKGLSALVGGPFTIPALVWANHSHAAAAAAASAGGAVSGRRRTVDVEPLDRRCRHRQADQRTNDHVDHPLGDLSFHPGPDGAGVLTLTRCGNSLRIGATPRTGARTKLEFTTCSGRQQALSTCCTSRLRIQGRR